MAAVLLAKVLEVVLVVGLELVGPPGADHAGGDADEETGMSAFRLQVTSVKFIARRINVRDLLPEVGGLCAMVSSIMHGRR